MVDSEVQNIILSITEFAQNLHMELETDLRDQLFSPINIHSLVVLLSSDPWFCNKEFFNAVLKIDVNSAATHYKHFFQALSHINDLKITNTCFSNANTVMQDDFKLQVKENFVHSINELDFTKTEATQTINSWIGDKTQGKLTFGGLNKDSWITFLSALHFKGNWSIPFASEETVSSPFYLNDQSSVDVRMMRRKDVFSYSYDEYLKTKILKLPFAGGQASLFIVLPNEGTSITELEAEPYFRYRPICSVTMSETEVDVSLPKFKLGESLELTECLKKIGLEEMFDACLAGVLEGGKELSCNQILQKVLLDVNETGAEAVAATHATLVEHRDEKILPKDGLVVYESKISSKVSNRFAKTVVVWRVKNTNANTADAKFKVILTDTAFITEFVMEIQGKSYKSYIKETEEAKNIYDEAVTQGRSAGLVEAKTRDSREFTVSVNLEPDSTAIFSLTYEEMLQRIHDQYELVLNINPGQIVDNLIIEVSIDESSPLKFVNIPPMRTGSDRNMTGLNKELDPKSTVEMKTSRNAFIKFCPDPVQQKKMTHYLGNKFNGGLSGQFVVQYDVERQPLNGEVLLLDGYFVHFFAPNDLDPLPKHIVFVLDTSTSMTGRKMDQLKDAMMNILGDLRMEDMLSILEFNSDVQVWDVATKNSTVLSEDLIKDFKEPFAYLKECILADPQRVSDSIISTAREVVQEISPCGCTFMIGGLETALYVVSMGRKQEKRKSDKLQPIIVFLTDGEPNVGIDSTDKIVELVTNLNSKDTVPIFSLSFGDDADKNFLRKLSLNNLGFSRHIYEAADASLQLQDFYKQISSPLLNDINFKYERDVAEVTRTRFPIYFRGSELVVAGRCKECDLPAHVDCRGPTGPVVIRSSIERPVTSLERLWAYLTVKQLLDDRETAANPDELTKKAVDLALRYSFVTDVTSLVVVKPDAGDTTLGTRINTNAGGNIDLDVEANPVPFLCYEQPEDITYSQKMKSPKKKVMKKRMIKKRKGDWRSDCEPVQVEDYITEVEPPELPEDKPTEEFKANRPFLVMLQVDIEGTSLILFQGRVLKPIY